MSDSERHWERIYNERAADSVSWYEPDPAESLRLIEHATKDRADAIIDVGAGASFLVDRLLERGHTSLAVLDIAPSALEKSAARLGESGRSVSWIQADVTKFRAAEPFAIWHDRAVFHFLTEPADRADYKEALLQSLAPNGQLIIATFSLQGPQKCSGLSIVRYDAPSLSAEFAPEFELQESRDVLHITPGGGQQAFIFRRFQRV